MKKFRDIEQLSLYLDGKLSPSETSRLESRITADPELASAFDDLRAARGILRKLPSRRAPRNFTLTRQMVGLKPPLPRSYSFFRFSTALATFLLLITFVVNGIAQLPRLSVVGGAAAPVAQEAYGMGGGPGAASEAPAAAAPVPAETQLPQGDANKALAETEAPAATEAPAKPLAVAPVSTASADMAATEAPMAKAPVTESVQQTQPEVKQEAIIPSVWQFVLLVVGLVSLFVTLMLRQSSKQKWK
jgi:anti-sigma factor RsiW